MKNYHAISVKFIGPTDFSPARVALKSLRFGSKLIVPIEPYGRNMLTQAVITLKKMGYTVQAMAENKGLGMILLVEEFKPFDRDLLK